MAIDLCLVDQLTMLAQAVEQLDIGLTFFDRELVLVAAHTRFQNMLNFPDALCRRGWGVSNASH